MTQLTPIIQRGQAALQAKNFKEAVVCFSKALENAPKDPQLLASLGQSLCWAGQRETGLDYLQQSCGVLLKKARKNSDVRQALMLVEQLHFWEDYHGALVLLKQVVKLNNREAKSFQLLALTCSRLNKNEQGLAAAKQALIIVPGNAQLNILAASLEVALKQYKNAHKRLEKVLEKASLTPEEQYRTHKELAKILDKREEYAQVFPHLHASSAAAKNIPEVHQQNASFVVDMVKTYTSEFDSELLARWVGADFSQDNPAPVFVMGFLRSGTTMTQEVLGAHSNVFVADEAQITNSMREELNRICAYKGNLPEQLKQINFAQVEQLRKFYWTKVHSRFGDAVGSKCFIDKTTMNTIDLGLINCIFPDSKVIFVLRDPRDICLSCLMQIMEPNPLTIQLLDWQGTADFYALVMNWWETIKKQMNMAFIEFRYEDAIANFDQTYGKVFDFINIPWDPSVTDFHKSAAKKFIVTPSFSQVSQPLYSSSVARWRHYEADFAAINPVLQPFVKLYGYT